jgi:hypothetical protein
VKIPLQVSFGVCLVEVSTVRLTRWGFNYDKIMQDKKTKRELKLVNTTSKCNKDDKLRKVIGQDTCTMTKQVIIVDLVWSDYSSSEDKHSGNGCNFLIYSI